MQCSRVSITRNYMYRNAQLRYTHIMYCTLWEECKQTQCPHRSWRERIRALMIYYSPTKNKLIYQVRANKYYFWLSGQYGKYNSNIFLFPLVCPLSSKIMGSEFFVLISSHCSSRIWRMRYGGSWSIYFLINNNFYFEYKNWCFIFWG